MKITTILIFLMYFGCATIPDIRTQIPPENIFFYEDFSDIDAGLIPDGWIGGSSLMVDSKGNFSTFQKRDTFKPHSFAIPNIVYPDDFTIEVTLLIKEFVGSYAIGGTSREKDYIYPIKIYFGNLEIFLRPQHNTKSWIDMTSFRFPTSATSNNRTEYLQNMFFFGKEYLNKQFTMKLIKKGEVFEVYINNEQCAIARYSNFQHNSSMNFEYSSDFTVMKIIGYVSE